MEDRISTSEARKRLSCTAQTIRNLIRAGKIQAAQLDNGRFLIDAISLQNYQQNEGQEALVAKVAKPKPKVWQNPKPKPIEPPSRRLVKEIVERYCSRPEWFYLYQTLLETEVNLDGIVLECIFRTPRGQFERFNTITAYSIPDDVFQFEEELFIDWYQYDLHFETAKHYLQTDLRWWLQLTCQDKVIIRSEDVRPPVSDLGLQAWVDDQYEATTDEQKMLLAQNKRRGQEDVVNLVLFGGAVALGLLLGLTSRPKNSYLNPGPPTP